MQTNTPSSPTLMPSPSRQVFWQRHVNQWRESGLSKRSYAQQHSLVYHQMVYWCSKDEQIANDRGSASSDFVAVSVKPAVYESGLSIRLPNGITIEGIDQNSIALIGKLVEQL